jgi:hypothetical protein
LLPERVPLEVSPCLPGFSFSAWSPSAAEEHQSSQLSSAPNCLAEQGALSIAHFGSDLYPGVQLHNCFVCVAGEDPVLFLSRLIKRLEDS